MSEKIELSKKYDAAANKATTIAVYLNGIANDLVKYPGYTQKHAAATLGRMKKDLFALMKELDKLQNATD